VAGQFRAGSSGPGASRSRRASRTQGLHLGHDRGGELARPARAERRPARQVGHDGRTAKSLESTKTSLRQRLATRASGRWPQLAGITVRWHGEFAYVAGQLLDGTALPLMRLRYNGSPTTWGFAVYRASYDDYDKAVLPSGCPFGTAGSPRLRLRRVPRPHHGLTRPTVPDELTGATTSPAIEDR
jgi:hypothetical protein